MNATDTYTVFAGDKHLVTAQLQEMLLQTKAYLDNPDAAPVLIFEDETGRQIDFDFRGTPEEVLARLSTHPLFSEPQAPARRHAGPGRPKLGVVSREISLLPRHWQWLERQPGGSSAALRRLVDEARKLESEKTDVGAMHDAAANFMLVMAGNLGGFEEVTRALYAGDYDKAKALMQNWPEDILRHAEKLLRRCEDAEFPNA